jgi:hypothetical protein
MNPARHSTRPVFTCLRALTCAVTNAPLTIHCADGETLVRVNQREEPPHARLWRTLGTFRFAAGRAGFVRIDNSGTADGYVFADAVQFLPVPPPATPNP